MQREEEDLNRQWVQKMSTEASLGDGVDELWPVIAPNELTRIMCHYQRLSRTAITRGDGNDVATSMASSSLMNSSMTVNTFKGVPLRQWS
jgi:hypothetical protein